MSDQGCFTAWSKPLHMLVLAHIFFLMQNSPEIRLLLPGANEGLKFLLAASRAFNPLGYRAGGYYCCGKCQKTCPSGAILVSSTQPPPSRAIPHLWVEGRPDSSLIRYTSRSGTSSVCCLLGSSLTGFGFSGDVHQGDGNVRGRQTVVPAAGFPEVGS